MALAERQVEQEIQHPAGRRAVERVLQRIEVRRAGGTEHDDLAVQPAAAQAQRLDRTQQRGQLVRPIVPAAGDQPRHALVDARHQPVAVELDLERPAARGRHAGARRCELRRQPRRQGGLDGVGQLRRLGRRRAGVRVGRG